MWPLPSSGSWLCRVTLEELLRHRVAVWGLGREGLAVAGLLSGRGAAPLLVDDDPVPAAARAAEVLDEGDVVLDPASVPWEALDVVVRSPGVSRYRPELEAARRAGTAVTTAMAVWLEDFADARVVAVTGTKGKSTTAALTAAILGEQGMDVALIGNIGVPVTDAYDRPLADAYVVEVSSYQAAEVTVSPGAIVLTSLAPDHLDWHGGEETYYRDKLRLVDAGPPGELAVNAASEEAIRRTAHHPFRMFFGPSGRVRLAPSGAIEADGEPLVDADRLRVPGHHNVVNLCGAIAGALMLGGTPPPADIVGRAVDRFDGLPSRCRTIGRRDGLIFVDDALASNPFATAASVEAFPEVELTVILGGADRGVDARQLAEALARRRPLAAVVVLPPGGNRVLDAIDALPGGRPDGMAVRQAGDLGEAVDLAVASTAAGGVVLFSPAAPTPEGEGGYRDRSRRFAEAAGLGRP
jgi:UDP-N-acetylmuramoyl-L-alanine---L-glutamate ligase